MKRMSAIANMGILNTRFYVFCKVRLCHNLTTLVTLRNGCFRFADSKLLSVGGS